MIFFAVRCAASERNMQRGGAAAQRAPEMRGPRGGADLWSPRARLHAGARGGYHFGVLARCRAARCAASCTDAASTTELAR